MSATLLDETLIKKLFPKNTPKVLNNRRLTLIYLVGTRYFIYKMQTLFSTKRYFLI